MAGEFDPSAGEMGDPSPETLEAFPGAAIARKKSKTYITFWDPGSKNTDTGKKIKILICGEYFVYRYTAHVQTQVQTQDGQFDLWYGVNIYAVHVDLHRGVSVITEHLSTVFDDFVST